MTDTDRIVLYLARHLLTGTPLTDDQKAATQQYITVLETADAHARVDAATDQLRALNTFNGLYELLAIPPTKQMAEQKKKAEQQLKVDTQNLASLMANNEVGPTTGKGKKGKGKGAAGNKPGTPPTADALIKQHIVWNDAIEPGVDATNFEKQEAFLSTYALVVQQYPQGYLWAAYKDMLEIPGQQSTYMLTMQLAKDAAEAFLIQVLVQQMNEQAGTQPQEPINNQ